jgi:hypothetical protein
MKLCTKVVAAMQHRLAVARASASIMGTCFNAVLFKFVTNEDHQAVLRGRKGLAGTKLGLDEDLTLAQQACKLKMWPLFKEAKATGKCATEFFVGDT